MPKDNRKELKLLQKAAREFSRKMLTPDREHNDRYPFVELNDEILKKAWEVGFFHLMLPSELEGMGENIAPLCTVLDQVCRADAGLGGVIFTNAVNQEIMQQAGASAKLKQIEQEAAEAKQLLIAGPVFDSPCETEVKPEAVKNGKRYAVSGNVSTVALGNIADFCLVPASVVGQDGFSYFLTALKQPDVSISDPLIGLGLHTCPLVDIRFKDAAALPVGEIGSGGDYFDRMANRLLVAAAAMSVGISTASINEAHAYAKNREQGGRKIIEWSELQMLLSEIALKTKVAEMSVSHAIEAVDTGAPDAAESVQAASIYAGAAACKTTSTGIQALGGYGYMKDYAQEKNFRDAKQVQALLGKALLKKLNFFNDHIRKNRK